jgi:hypothetical protein
MRRIFTRMKKQNDPGKEKITRRDFIKKTGLIVSSLALAPLLEKCEFIHRGIDLGSPNVYMSKNGTFTQNVDKVLELMGGIERFVDPTDIVVIKANGQWLNQGYTHTGCIKALIDRILSIPFFSGEIIICDNIQRPKNTDNLHDTSYGFNAGSRINNWPDESWLSLAAKYSKVSVKSWESASGDASSLTNPDDVLSMPTGTGWVRDYFAFHGINSFLSYPVFESPLTPGRVIDMKKGVWESGRYTGRKVKAIFMPTLNNHGAGSEDSAGITSAIKCFFGTTEIHTPNNDSDDGSIVYNGNTYYAIHHSSFQRNNAEDLGELAARYIENMYSPVLYLTAAMWSGYNSRTGTSDAVETKTVLGCTNPATLDYVAAKVVISPYAPFLNPDNDNNTRKQILGCVRGGVGTINELQFKTISHTFL